jgi:hypothetical protein
MILLPKSAPRIAGRLIVGVVAAAILSASPVLAAAPPAAALSSTKEQVLVLYTQGKELLDAGKTAEACRAFEAAKRLDSSAINLILRLGDCYERLGRTASAYGEYQQAASVAAAAKDARRVAAEERVAAVEPHLARLAVALAPGAAGVTVRRNGDVVAAEELGKLALVDPGRFTFEATAAGKKPWTTAREIAPGATVTIEIPALAPLVVVVAVAAPAPVAEGASSPRSAIGIALGGVGLVGLGVGVGFGVKALSNLAASRADNHCDAASFCDDVGFQLRRDAQDAGRISTVTLALGATATVVGALLWLTAPAGSKAPLKRPASTSFSHRSALEAGASGDAHNGSVWLRGAF